MKRTEIHEQLEKMGFKKVKVVFGATFFLKNGVLVRVPEMDPIPEQWVEIILAKARQAEG